MTKREEFVAFVDELIANCKYPVEMSENVSAYLAAIREEGTVSEKPAFTSNGKAILCYLQTVPPAMYKARDIADGLGMSSKSVSGAMRKLVTDGYIEKVGKDPVVYTITEKGKNVNFDEGDNE